MSNILVLIISLIVAGFVDSMFLALGVIHIAPMIVIYNYNKDHAIGVAVGIALYSMFFDTYYALFWGSYLLAFYGMIFVHSFTKRLIPYENPIWRGFSLLLSFYAFHLITLGLLNLQIHDSILLPDPMLLLDAFIESLFEVGVYLAVTGIVSRFVGGSSKDIKVRFK